MVYEIKQKEFCRITGLTRKALLVYEGKGLLLPYRTDHKTGYRYYNEENLLIGSKISFLRNLNFSLEEIQELLSDSASSAMLLKKRAEVVAHEIAKLQNGLDFININQNYPFPLNSDLREITQSFQYIASIEGRGTIRDIEISHKVLYNGVIKSGGIPSSSAGTYYYKDSENTNLHFKVFIPLSSWVAQNGSFTVEPFLLHRFLFIRCFGSYELLPFQYKKLIEELKTCSVENNGEYIEFYRVVSKYGGVSKVTDIGVPVWI